MTTDNNNNQLPVALLVFTGAREKPVAYLIRVEVSRSWVVIDNHNTAGFNNQKLTT
jgi:hypothetical protein